MNNYFYESFNILSAVYIDKAYINIALADKLTPDSRDKALITRICYGVIEKNYELEDILLPYLKSKPKPKIYLLLKIAAYCLIYLNSLPDYAVVSNAVDVAGKINGGALRGLVNAVCRTLIKDKNNIVKNDLISCPKWLKGLLIKQYGAKANDILSLKKQPLKHIRHNDGIMTLSELTDLLDKNDVWYSISPVGGLFVKHNDFISELFSQGKITYQSSSSMLTVKVIDPVKNGIVLDLCSAPGGKAVYLSELRPDLKIIACDIYEHRLTLIDKYCSRMKITNITTLANDATKYNAAFDNKFDVVLCDVTCSGTGVLSNRPDILLNREYDDIKKLNFTQTQILNNAARYCKKDGSILYSTCSVLTQENIDIVNAFLANNSSYRLKKLKTTIENDGKLQLLPSEKWDGFFMAQLERYE